MIKTLIVYYSYTGNTKQIAHQLADQLHADLAEIRTAAPYTGSYDQVVDQGAEETRRGYEPLILPLDKDPAGYDVILLGTPVWWYTFAPAVKTFLSQTDLTGKVVRPFVTNGGWIGHTEQDIAAACPGARVEKAINIRFNGKRLSTPEADICSWAEKVVHTA